MDVYDEVQVLSEEYINNVLIHLFPNINDKKNGFGKSLSLSPGTFAIELNESALLQSYPDYKTSSNSFLHFTTIKSLHSILNEGYIRMYNLANGNDPNEVTHTLAELNLDAKQISDFKTGTFALSLCNSEILNSENVLNLWRLYGDKGWGIAIEFEFQNVNENNTDFMLANIIYQKLQLQTFNLANKEFELKHERKVNLFDLLKVPSCLHKSAYFKIEKEVRLLYSFGWNVPPFLSFDNKLNIKYDFNSRNQLVSYYCLKLFNKTHSIFPFVNIKSIQVGFKYNEDQFKLIMNHLHDVINGYLESYKINLKIDIKQSELKDVYI